MDKRERGQTGEYRCTGKNGKIAQIGKGITDAGAKQLMERKTFNCGIIDEHCILLHLRSMKVHNR
jgi:hypothetical protein